MLQGFCRKKIKITQFPDGFYLKYYITGVLATPGFVFVDGGSWESQKEEVEEIMGPFIRGKISASNEVHL